MALFADHAKMRVQRPASPDLDHLAHFVRTCRLPYQTNIHPFARLLHVIQQGAGAVDAFGFLVTGDCQHDGPIRGRVADKVDGRGGKGGHTGFHIGGAAPVHDAVFDLCAKGRHRPIGLVPDGHDIGVTVKAEAACVTLVAPTRKEVLDPATVRPGTVKPRLGQQIEQHLLRAPICGGDRRATHQFGGQVYGIDAGHMRAPSACVAVSPYICGENPPKPRGSAEIHKAVSHIARASAAKPRRNLSRRKASSAQ